MSRNHVFRLELIYLLILAGLFVAWEVSPGFRAAFPERFGDLPSTVPWFGAMGGTLISLTGVFKHDEDWQERYELWHWARPLVGAFLGSMGALIFAVIVATATARSAHESNGAVYDVVAFLLGYREATFRQLIQRATDLLLASSDKEAHAEVVSREPKLAEAKGRDRAQDSEDAEPGGAMPA